MHPLVGSVSSSQTGFQDDSKKGWMKRWFLISFKAMSNSLDSCPFSKWLEQKINKNRVVTWVAPSLGSAPWTTHPGSHDLTLAASGQYWQVVAAKWTPLVDIWACLWTLAHQLPLGSLAALAGMAASSPSKKNTRCHQRWAYQTHIRHPRGQPQSIWGESEEDWEPLKWASEPEKWELVSVAVAVSSPAGWRVWGRWMTSVNVQRLGNRISNPAKRINSFCLPVTSLLQSIAHSGTRWKVLFLENPQSAIVLMMN